MCYEVDISPLVYRRKIFEVNRAILASQSPEVYPTIICLRRVNRLELQNFKSRFLQFLIAPKMLIFNQFSPMYLPAPPRAHVSACPVHTRRVKERQYWAGICAGMAMALVYIG